MLIIPTKWRIVFSFILNGSNNEAALFSLRLLVKIFEDFLKPHTNVLTVLACLYSSVRLSNFQG